jgi:hypothetical protein
MVDLFNSPRLTLARAHHHIHEFNEVINTFITEKPWTHFVDKDAETGRDLYKVKLMKEPPGILSCILFDAANNLRAVLDQVGYASAVASGNTSLKAIKFPFGPTEQKWRNNLAGGCKDLPAEIRTIFEQFKAYSGGNDTLWATNEIANANKHLALKALLLTRPDAFFSARIEMRPGGLEEIISPGGAGIGWDSRKNEITLFAAQPGAKTDIHINITASIAIEGIKIQGCETAPAFLDTARNEVERVLVATEAECRRLGFQIE